MKKSRREFIKRAGIGAGSILISKFAFNENLLGATLEARPYPTLTSESSFITDEFVKSDFYYKRLNDNDCIIHGINITLKPDEVSPNHNLTVYADKVDLIGTLKLPGKKVFIHCRQFVTNGESAIDVSGKSGEGYDPSDTTPPMRDGINISDNGTNGRKGAEGNPGGEIKVIAGMIGGNITFYANGGAGAPGERGGNGAQGPGGGFGRDGKDVTGAWAGGQGGQGGRGGNGGAGGVGGNGGAAGMISVKYRIRRDKATSIKFAAFGGKGGPGGKHGSAGPGGPGGPGGFNFFKCREVGRDNPVTKCESDGTRASSGPQGPWGSSVSGGNASNGSDGKSNQEQIKNADWSSNNKLWGQTASISQILILLHYIEIRYLNEKYQDVGLLLSWLESVTEDNPGSQTAKINEIGSPSPTTIVPTKAEWGSIRKRVQVLRAQLRAGLDFYGMPRNYVPSVSLESYQETIRELTKIARNIETSYKNYFSDKQSAEQRVAALRTAVDNCRLQLQLLGSEGNKIASKIDEEYSQITALTDRLEMRKQALMAAGQELENEIKARTGGCNLGDALTFAASLYATYQTGFVGIQNVYQAVNKFSNSEFAVTNAIQTIKTVGSNLDEIKNAYNGLKDKLSNLRSNEAKIAISLENYEKVLAPFKDLGAAKKYEQQVSLFLDVAQTRNQKIMDYSSLLIQKEKVAAQLKQLQEEMARQQSLLAQKAINPSLVECVTFMDKLLTEAKANLIYFLYQEHRAYEYWGLTTEPFNVWDQDITGLEAKHGQIVGLQMQKAEARNRAPQQLITQVVLKSDDYPEIFDELRQTGKMIFTLPESHEAFNRGWSSVTIREAMVEVAGVKTSDNILSVKLTHAGKSRFVDTQRRIIDFTHHPRSTNITYNLLDGKACAAGGNIFIGYPCTPLSNNLGAGPGNGYAYLSPFATWNLEIPDSVNKGLDRNGITEIKLLLTGQFLPFQ